MPDSRPVVAHHPFETLVATRLQSILRDSDIEVALVAVDPLTSDEGEVRRAVRDATHIVVLLSHFSGAADLWLQELAVHTDVLRETNPLIFVVLDAGLLVEDGFVPSIAWDGADDDGLKPLVEILTDQPSAMEPSFPSGIGRDLADIVVAVARGLAAAERVENDEDDLIALLDAERIANLELQVAADRRVRRAAVVPGFVWIPALLVLAGWARPAVLGVSLLIAGYLWFAWSEYITSPSMTAAAFRARILAVAALEAAVVSVGLLIA